MKQRWEHAGGGDRPVLSFDHGRRCIDADPATAGSNGGQVYLWDCNGSPQQHWTVTDSRLFYQDVGTVGAGGSPLGTVAKLWKRAMVVTGKAGALGLEDMRSLDYTVLLCSKMDDTRTFYRDVLGFPVDADLGTWVSFRLGTAVLALRPRGTAPAGEDGPAVAGSAAVQLAFRVPLSVLHECHEELVAKGVPILKEPSDLPAWRHRTLFFRDPEGNLIEIYAEY